MQEKGNHAAKSSADQDSTWELSAQAISALITQLLGCPPTFVLFFKC